MINLMDISVSYGDNTVYKNFNFCFDEGINVVLGKSGCGKTTLLNVVADLIPFEGKCEKQGQVAMVFQQPCLAPVSVWKNVDLVLPKGDNSAKIQEVLSAVQLLEKKCQKATTLSGGEQQRVSLARAFVSGRKILLLDEPFSNLDFGVKLQLRQILHRLLQNESKTVVLVTHDIDEALSLADRIYLLENKPAALRQVAGPFSSDTRDEFDQEFLLLKKQLQQMLI